MMRLKVQLLLRNRENNEGIGWYAKVKKVDDPLLLEYFRSYSKDIKSSYT
jgi:hypothetical protein